MGVSINFSSTMRRMGKLHASGLSVKLQDKTDKKQKNADAKKKENQGVSVTISKEGQEKAEQLRKEKLEAVKQEAREARTSLAKVTSMISRLENGEELSEEERRFLTDEMKNVAATNYILKRDHQITKDEYKYLLEETEDLKDNYIKRVDALSGMQKQLEQGNGLSSEKDVESMLAKAKLDQEEKQRLVDILRDIFEQDDEEVEEASGEETEGEEELTDEEIEEEKNANTTEDNLKKRALDVVKRNKEIVDNIAEDSRNAFSEADFCNEQMDKIFLEFHTTLTDDSKSIEEKVEAYQNTNAEIAGLLREKMKFQAQGLFDGETAVMTKIEYNLHNDLDEVIKGGYKDKGSAALDMMLDFLINNKFIKSDTYDYEHPEMIEKHMYEIWE